MLKKLSFILLAVLIIAFAGCSSKPETVMEDETATLPPIQDIQTQPQNTSDMPQFFLMPPISDEAMYGVGVAKMSSLDMSRTMALSRARDDIARQVDLQVKNAISDYAQEAGAGSSQTIQFVETVSRQIAETKLRGARPIEIYAAKDGTIYALVEYKISNLEADAAAVFKRNEEAAFSEFKASQALERLNFELMNNPTISQPVTE